MNPLIILSGPTAVGKTSLSIELAKKIGGSIISADSMQVYKGMNIGTAKITKEQMQGIPHYLIDILDATEDFNIAAFKEMAQDSIARIKKEGRIPIIVGGTGFYIQSVLYDIDFTEHEDDPEYRRNLARLINEKGGMYVHKMLEECDPEGARSIHFNDHKRIIRALEYYRQTGHTISEHNRTEYGKESPYDFCYFVLTDDRVKIYDRINERVDEMIKEGLVDEVKGLLANNVSPDNISMQGIGYKEIIAYLDGSISLDEATCLIKKNSRHFAKRQLTWFKRERDVIFIDRRYTDDPLETILSEIKKAGLINEQ